MGMTLGAVVYLTRSCEQSLQNLERSLSLLASNFLPWSPADVIVMHESDWNPAGAAQRLSGVNVQYACVDFSAVPEGMEKLSRRQRGYRHMCHFFANDIFLRNELSDYRYVMRMDDDSYILSPLRQNVFETMQKHAFLYAYRAIVKDKQRYCAGLWPLAERYFHEAAGAVRPFGEVTPRTAYYTNFEICDLQWFRDEPWQAFFRMIDQAGGIWKYRWGDHVIRYIGVQALMPESRIWCVTPMHYRHQSEWRPGYQYRLPHDLLRYYCWLGRMLIKEKLGGWLQGQTDGSAPGCRSSTRCRFRK
jgi:alpha 1,2-mannosyltransferase